MSKSTSSPAKMPINSILFVEKEKFQTEISINKRRPNRNK